MNGEKIQPWLRSPLDKWLICGMNHYHVDGKRMLFVSMVKDGKCITSEGEDNWVIWNNLSIQSESEEPNNVCLHCHGGICINKCLE